MSTNTGIKIAFVIVLTFALGTTGFFITETSAQNAAQP
jgi:hypothetical protein